MHKPNCPQNHNLYASCICAATAQAAFTEALEKPTEAMRTFSNEQLETIERIKVSDVRCAILESPDISVMEYRALVAALEAGRTYGYGNVISWLATEWATRLIQKGMTKEAAIAHVSNRSPYPLPESSEP